MRALKSRSFALSFDGENIYYGYGPCHPPIHEKYPDLELLDFRYYMDENVLSVWISDPSSIVRQLLSFRDAYVREERKPFPSTAKLVLASDGWAVRCGMDEIEKLSDVDDNSYLRCFHVWPPSLRPRLSPEWKESYRKEGNAAWASRHGNIDPAEYHLLAYDE